MSTEANITHSNTPIGIWMSCTHSFLLSISCISSTIDFLQHTCMYRWVRHDQNYTVTVYTVTKVSSLISQPRFYFRLPWQWNVTNLDLPTKNLCTFWQHQNECIVFYWTHILSLRAVCPWGWKSLAMIPNCLDFSMNISRCCSNSSNWSAIISNSLNSELSAVLYSGHSNSTIEYKLIWKKLQLQVWWSRKWLSLIVVLHTSSNKISM